MTRLLTLIFIAACMHIGWRYINPPESVMATEMTTEAMTQLAATVGRDDVVMYTTTHCPYCAQARSWLNQYGFAFTECDAEARPECARQLQALGGMGVPYLMVRGQHMEDGFDSDEFLSLLNH